MTDLEYNGWRNKPTWLVNVWLDEYGHRDTLNALAKHIAAEQPDPVRAMVRLSDSIRVLVDEICEDATQGAGLAADLLGWAAAMADCDQLAKAYLDDVEGSEQ